MIVNEVKCKTILSKSGLYGIDYSLNPYRGCSHNCAYCYAPDILREQRKWGEFLDVKANAPEVLSKELKRIENDIENLSKSKAGTELFVPVSAGIYAKAKIDDTDKLLVNVGANTAVMKSVGDSKKLIADQIDNLNNVKQEMVVEFQNLSVQAAMLQAEITKAAKK